MNEQIYNLFGRSINEIVFFTQLLCLYRCMKFWLWICLFQMHIWITIGMNTNFQRQPPVLQDELLCEISKKLKSPRCNTRWLYLCVILLLITLNNLLLIFPHKFKLKEKSIRSWRVNNAHICYNFNTKIAEFVFNGKSSNFKWH